MKKKKEIKFVFDNARAAEHFVTWLCESGEQAYWEWMQYREQEELGNITVRNFNYWGAAKGTGSPPTTKDFGKEIHCPCGRMDSDPPELDE